MTIVISALTPGGIVMAGEGRVIQPEDQSAFVVKKINRKSRR